MTSTGYGETESAAEPLGSTLPRLWTRPLAEGPPGPCGCGCALTPVTSYGFEVADFAATTLGTPLDPWERWLVIHAGEMISADMPRFRHILVIVARQNGKTWLLTVLALYWLFVDRWPLILSTSTNLEYAKEAWSKGVDLVQANERLARDLPAGTRGSVPGVRTANGQEAFTTKDKSRWKIAASNRRGGRSLTIDRLVMDELREHDSWEAWNAAVPATNALPFAQIWGISNQGDSTSVVLNARRAVALEETDRRRGLFEWSAPEGSRATDPHALAMANPNMNRRGLSTADLVSEAEAATTAGGEQLTKFLTEILCIPVKTRLPAIDAAMWADCLGPVDLAPHRARLAVCIDVSLDGLHATAVAAAVLPDERVAVDVIGAWHGPAAAITMQTELPRLLDPIRPRVLGWLPEGPAAMLAAGLRRAVKSRAARRNLPRRMTIEEMTGDACGACMSFAEMVRAGMIVQPGDPLLDAQVCDAERYPQGDKWRFTRRGVGHCDAAYATAGAVHLAMSLPPAPPPLSGVPSGQRSSEE
jgi:hypothetical protein